VTLSLPQSVLLSGAERVPVTDTILRAGPLRLIFREGAFRYIKLHESEIIRAVYVAVRDENWRTIPGVISNLDIRSAPDSFKITYDSAHLERDIDFHWKAMVTGDTVGTIVWRMEGSAFTSFQKNRIGICVLHPLAESIGKSCQINHTDGTIEHSCFPVVVAPHQPFMDVAAMSFRVNSDLDAELSFAGDVFETEDQRNWSDASFKTYSTPLSIPYPARIKKGTTVSQTFTLNLRGTLPTIAIEPPLDAEVTIALHPESRTRLPKIGFKFAGSHYRLSEAGAQRFKLLCADHLGTDLRPGDSASEGEFWNAAEEARRLKLPLEVALAADGESAALNRVLKDIVDRKVEICSWLADVGMQLPSRTAELRELEAIARVVLGSAGNFAELNRNRPSMPPAADVWFSLNPQVHATDDTTLVENLAAQPSVLTSIRSWNGNAPITVSPVSLKSRILGSDDRASLAGNNDLLPEDVDQRQTSLLGAGWTLGTLKHMAEGEVASVTFYETAGWRGIMQTAEGSPSPAHFLSIPDAVFPMYHVFSDVAAYKCGEVIRSETSDPLRIESLALIQSSGLRVMVANLSASEVKVNLKLAGVAEPAELLTIDEDNVECYMIHPESRMLASTQRLAADERCVRFGLGPYAIATIDVPPEKSELETESAAPGGRS
jgi:hypothetical protein